MSIVTLQEVMLDIGLSSSATEEETAIITAAIKRAEGAVKRYLRYDPVLHTRTEFYPQTDYGRRSSDVWDANDTHAYLRELSEGATSELCLKGIPVRSITSLFIDYDGRGGSKTGAFGSSTVKVEGEDFWPNYDRLDSSGNKVCADGIIRSMGMWPTTAGSIKVVYVAGYSSAELHGEDDIIDAYPIVYAVTLEAVRRTMRAFTVRKRTGAGFVPGIVTSEGLGDYNYSVDAGSANKLMMSGDITSESKDALASFVNWGAL